MRRPTETRDDDAALIESSGAEPEAFGEIFGRHATEIHRFAARRLGGGLAEDVVSEVFLVAFRRRESWPRPGTARDRCPRDRRSWCRRSWCRSARSRFQNANMAASAVTAIGATQ